MISALEKNPKQGSSLGRDCYKIRMIISDKGKGKSAGARVITHVYVAKNFVYLLSIYDKASQDDISDKELKQLLKQIQDKPE